jgi:uroporphyrinogen III methyltransferase/synthase
VVTVSLIGAGPGDPGLLTRRGAELLARADVVVHDRLIAPELLELAPPGAQLIDVGKAPGASTPQSEINAQLVELARSGRDVVRLKGGDPFVFGRGGEEAEALRNAGIDFEVVPGVSSAFAAPAAAGIPVTHRGLATSVSVVTGHVGDPSAPGGVDWASLGRAGGTLVILMGMSERARISDELIRSGRDADTPVAVVHWGTTARQEVARTTLEGLIAVELPAPSIIVVGPVAALDLGPAREHGSGR